MRYDIKRRLIPLEKNLTDLHLAVIKKGEAVGFKIAYSELCRAVNGKLLEPRADKAVEIANEVVKEWEGEKVEKS